MFSTAMKYTILLSFYTILTYSAKLSAQNVYPPEYDHGVSLPTTKPLIIAHRGASGVLPEHTREAYSEALTHGADVIECDVCVTRDLHLVCLHESWMSETTNVADVFPPERMNTYYIFDNNVEVTDYFTVDFSLEELKTIRSRQRLNFRDPNYDDQFEIATLEEQIELARGADRPVGIYPETKNPQWVNSLEIIQNANTTFEDLLLEVLSRHGYGAASDPCFIQSFDFENLRYLSTRTALPLIQLLSTPVSDSRLLELAGYCYGIGPSKSLIVVPNAVTGNILEITDLVERAHNVSLRVHPYTFRNENQYLLWDYKQDPFLEYETFLRLGIDGYFTDFPETLMRFVNATYV